MTLTIKNFKTLKFQNLRILSTIKGQFTESQRYLNRPFKIRHPPKKISPSILKPHINYYRQNIIPINEIIKTSSQNKP